MLKAHRRWSAIVLSFLVSTLCLACHRAGQGSSPIVVGSADSPEQMVIGKMTVSALRSAGYKVVDKTGLGTPAVVRAALEAGNIDVCWEYTGDAWLNHLKHDFPIANPQEAYEKVRAEDALNQLAWLRPAPYQRTLALLMREQDAQAHGIGSVSELARYMAHQEPGLRLCVPQELYDKGSGIRGLERVYRLHFQEEGVRFLPIQEGYKALQGGECDCALGLSGDSDPAAKGLRALRDDRGFFQASNLAPVVRMPVLRELPELEKILGELSSLLTQEAMADIQRQVAEGSKPQTIARRFLAKSRSIRSLMQNRK